MSNQASRILPPPRSFQQSSRKPKHFSLFSPEINNLWEIYQITCYFQRHDTWYSAEQSIQTSRLQIANTQLCQVQWTEALYLGPHFRKIQDMHQLKEKLFDTPSIEQNVTARWLSCLLMNANVCQRSFVFHVCTPQSLTEAGQKSEVTLQVL